MKVTLNWLKQYVDFNWSPEELAERLTMLGLEVEGVHKVAGEFDGIVVAQVITRDKHPNADKLSVCRVNDGTGERQIVCGAQNFKAGDKVPLILPGASLPLKAVNSLAAASFVLLVFALNFSKSSAASDSETASASARNSFTAARCASVKAGSLLAGMLAGVDMAEADA